MRPHDRYDNDDEYYEADEYEEDDDYGDYETYDSDEHWRDIDDVQRSYRRLSPRTALRPQFLMLAGICAACLIVTVWAFHPRNSGGKDPMMLGMAQPDTTTAVTTLPDFQSDSVPTPTVAGATTTSTTTPAEVSTLTTNSDDLDEVTRALFQLKHASEQNPNLDALNQLYVAGSPAANHFSQDMQALIADNSVGSQPQADVVSVNVLMQSGSNATVAADTQYGTSTPLVETLKLVRGDDGQWRISDWLVANASQS